MAINYYDQVNFTTRIRNALTQFTTGCAMGMFDASERAIICVKFAELKLVGTSAEFCDQMIKEVEVMVDLSVKAWNMHIF